MIHVAIDARLPDKGQGGVQQVIRSLAEGFRSNQNGEVKRSWIVYKGTQWWKNVIPAEDNLISINPPFGKMTVKIANLAPALVSRLYPIVSKFRSSKPPLDDQLRNHQVDLVHMPFQDGFVTELPYIYHPHDLQHEYFPENFSRSQYHHRNFVWRNLALRASCVLSASQLVKDDIQRFWGLNDERIAIVPIPPPTRKITKLPHRFSTEKYLIYPAAFWPHKNHICLLHAMSFVVSSRPEVNLVLCGASGSELQKMKDFVKQRSLGENVHFIGHVPDSALGDLIQDSLGVVIPSKFEAYSLTAWDSFNLKKPLICSNIATFKLQFGDSINYFNPDHPEELAVQILEMIKDGVNSDYDYTNAPIAKIDHSLVKLAQIFERMYKEVYEERIGS